MTVSYILRAMATGGEETIPAHEIEQWYEYVESLVDDGALISIAKERAYDKFGFCEDHF